MTLHDWILKTEPKKVAQLLKVDDATVSYWKTGKALPRPEKMIAIHKLSRGRVSYKSMVENFLGNKK